MMDRYAPPEVLAAAERDVVARRFNEKSRYFDPELFMEGYDAMAAEFAAADRTGRRTLLTNRFFDGFAPVDDAEIADSQFEDRFCVRAPERIISADDGAREGGIAGLLDPVRARMSLSRYGRMWQQGPSRVFDLPPGNFIEVDALGRQDVIGSDGHTACTAIVARKDSKTFMAHILGSNSVDLNKTLDVVRGLGYATDRTRMFSPYWATPDGTTTDSWNHRLARIAGERGLSIDFFPYVGSDDHNPDDIRHTAVLVGRNALWSVGVDIKTIYKKTKRGEIAQERTVIRGLTYRDYE